MRPSRLLQLLLVAALGLPHAATAELDGVQSGMLAPYALPLRWDNLERSPDWVRGPQPFYDKATGLHIVRLAPGAQVSVRVAAGAMLRVKGMRQPLDPARLRVWVANGTGLDLTPRLQKTTDGHDWLAQAEFASPAIYRLENLDQAALEVALFSSRNEPLDNLAPYRQLLPLPGKEIALQLQSEAAPRRYWKIPDAEPITLRVTGPRRLELENRLTYPESESRLRQTWQVTAHLDGTLLHTAELESNVESLQEIKADGKPVVTSREERLFLEIPEGDHTLTLTSTAPLLARLLLQDSTDYLFPTLNQPRITAESVRSGLDPARAARTSWQRNPAEIPSMADQVEQAAQRLAMDSRWREGGMAGAALLDQAAIAHPEDAALASRANVFAGTHTFFRDLLPRHKDSAAHMQFRWFRLPRLNTPGQNRNLVVSPQHTQSMLAHLGSACFVTLPAKPTEPPPQPTTSGTSRAEQQREVMFFEPYSDRITAATQAQLESVAARWRKRDGQALEIHGYTASNADTHDNRRLSERRAQAVANALHKLGVKAIVQKTEGRGIADPAGDNHTRSGRQQNRRVEITFTQPSPPDVPMALPRRPEVARYLLPESWSPRQLRLIAHGAAQADFMLQIDQQPAQRLRFSASGRMSSEAFAPSLGDGGLLLQSQEEARQDAGTEDPAFSRFHTPAPLIEAGYIEMTLPAGSREIRLWRMDEDARNLQVAVQYEASAPFQLSEREFLAWHALDQDDGAPLRAALRKEWSDSESPGGELLASQWRPLARLLTSELRQARAGVRPDPAPQPAPSVDTAGLRRQAQEAEAQGQWLLALETWSRVWFSNAPVRLREEARWHRIEALHHLGEDFMFEQMLKQILFFESDTQYRIRAIERLERHYRESDDPESLLRLHALAIHWLDDPVWWRKLADSLLANGEDRLALLAGLALPPQQRPHETLLQAAWKLEWWRTFDHLQASLDSPAKRAFWQGMRDIAKRRFDTAAQQFDQAEERGHAFAAHLRDGLALRETSTADPERLANWQRSTPGPYQWHDAPDTVQDFAGALPGYAIDRDLHFSLYKATDQHPLQLRVAGPTRIRLEIRPIHAAADAPALDGWVTVNAGNGLWVAPIIANQPSEGLQLADGTLLGRKIVLDLPVSAGAQTLRIHAGALPVAIRVYREQPALPPGILPAPHLHDAEPDARQITFIAVTEADPWYRQCEDCLIVPGMEPGQPTRRFRMAINPSRAIAPPALPPAAPLPEAAMLASGDFDRLLAGIELTAASPRDVLQRMTWLLWTGESSPRHYERTLAMAQALAAANPGMDGLSRLLDRLSRRSGWTALETVQESAGIRLLSVTGWQPESPASRIQKALLTPLADNEQIVSGNARMVLSLRNTRRGKVEFDVRAEDLGGLPPQPLQLKIQRDDEAAQLHTLTPGNAWETHTIEMPSGRHALRFSVQDPVANQVVRIRLRESRNQPVANQFERPYQVATTEQPIRAVLPGPTWLRVDEWRDGKSLSRYQYLSEAWQTVTLLPEPGHKEALLRLHARTPAPAQPTVPPRHIETPRTPVPPPPVSITPPVRPDTIRLSDEFKLGGQEDGTWTWAIEGHSRYDADSQGKEKFIENSLAYRYFDASERTYYTAQGLVRVHQDGNPTLGVRLRADHTPWLLPFEVFAEANAYAQTIPLAGNHWSANLKTGISQRRNIDPKTWHTPWATAFARKLGAGNARHPENVDQDVYTQYKSQHRFGYEIGDRLSYRPYLDTLLQASVGITSNENLVTPDKLGFTAEWKQLLGDWQVDARARLTHYFSDQDRPGSINRREIGVGARWEHWLPNQDRVEATLDLTRNFDAGGNWGWLGLRWHFGGNGRAYRDFRPGEIDFRDLRERNLPDQPNNRIEAEAP